MQETEKRIVLAFKELLEEDGLLKYVIEGKHIVGYYELRKVAEKLGMSYDETLDMIKKLIHQNPNIRLVGVLHKFVDDKYVVGLDTEWFRRMVRLL